VKTHYAAAIVFGTLLFAVPRAVPAETYNVDSMHSMPSFTFRHLGLSSFRGRFDKLTGTIELDMAQHRGSADIVIAIDSVSTGVPMLDQFLRSQKFFDATKFPTATFKSSSFKFSGTQLVAVTGDLSLHGVTRPVVLEVAAFACREHPLLKVASCGADASVNIKRSDFGLDAFIGNDSDEVRLDIAVEALKAAPAQER
jgi:polyisoprenoid-binding protein YceI